LAAGDAELDALVEQVMEQVAADPEAMRKIAERSFDVGLTLVLEGEEAAIAMLVADGVPEDFARTTIRDLVQKVIR